MDKIEVVHYHQRVTVNGITFEALNAGHVLGAAQVEREIVWFVFLPSFLCFSL